MVKYILALFFLFCTTQISLAAHTPGREIVQIRIDESGRSDDESENVKKGCQDFKVTIDDVKNFFLKAWPVPLKFNVHERYSPCYAKGFIEFNDNTRGKWKISSSGGAILWWDTGDTAALFYNNYKWTDPFENMYGSEG